MSTLTFEIDVCKKNEEMESRKLNKMRFENHNSTSVNTD